MSVGSRIARGMFIFILITALITPVVGAAPAVAQPGPEQSVIVVLADQHENVPATASDSPRRRGLPAADQGQLASQAGARDITQFKVSTVSLRR